MNSIDLNKQYVAIKNWCRRRLPQRLHGRHLEDLVQHIAMEVWENSSEFEQRGFSGRWDWYFANYCRANGLHTERSKQSSRALEIAFNAETTEEKKEYILNCQNDKKDEIDYSAKDEEKAINLLVDLLCRNSRNRKILKKLYNEDIKKKILLSSSALPQVMLGL